MANIIFVDTETGGLDPKKSSLLSLGAVFVKDGQTVLEKEWFLKPWNDAYKVTAGALSVNKINLIEHDKHAVDYYDASHEFIVAKQMLFGKDKIRMGGHNTQFDVSFIKEYLDKEVMDEFSHRLIDTCSIADALCSAGKLSSDSVSGEGLIAALGVTVEGERHTALADARMARDFYFKMVDLMKGES